MNLVDTIRLATALIETIGPLLVRIASAKLSGGDVIDTLVKERVDTILPATSRLELSEQAARLRAAHADGSVALTTVQLALVQSALAMHDVVTAASVEGT